MYRHLQRVAASALTLAVCSAAATSLDAQTTAAAANGTWTIPHSDRIRALLAERMAQNGVGVVVGVIEPAGRRVIAYGRSGAPDGRPLDGDSLFQIGSVTKVFTGLLLADVAVRGEVKLEDSASGYLPPGVRMPQRGRPITLIDLSKHWSGLPPMPTNFSLDANRIPTKPIPWNSCTSSWRPTSCPASLGRRNTPTWASPCWVGCCRAVPEWTTRICCNNACCARSR